MVKRIFSLKDSGQPFGQIRLDDPLVGVCPYQSSWFLCLMYDVFWHRTSRSKSVQFDPRPSQAGAL